MTAPGGGWPALQRLRQYGAARGRDHRPRPDERCDMCGASIDDEHGHIVGLQSRSLMCVCRACHLLFTQDGAGGGRFCAVPDRYVRLMSLETDADRWELFQIPVGLMFFFRNSATGKVTGFYPSPAGATESELPLDAWDALTAAAPDLLSLRPDVEALLIRRDRTRTDALIVPIDACYELVGRIRRAWRGFQGGDEVQKEITDLFDRFSRRADKQVPV